MRASDAPPQARGGRAFSLNLPFCAVLALYLLLAGALAWTKRPWADEAWFANTSVNIMQTGKTGISVLDPLGNANTLGREVAGIDREFYVWLPVQQSLNTLWYSLAGFSVVKMRLPSMFWGALGLFSWLVIVRRLTGSERVACLAVLLIGTDFAFLDAAADGRMDIMCAALSSCAIALYLALREKNLSGAIAGSQALTMTAGLTHPIGAVGFIAALFLIVRLDWRRIRRTHLALACGVYLAGLAVVAAYFLPNLPLAKSQLAAALAGRTDVASTPGATFVRELTQRYRSFYFPAYAHGSALIRAFIPLIYALGLAMALGWRRVRTQPGSRTLIWLAVISLVSIATLDSGKSYYYLVHSTPWLAVVLALGVATLWATGTRLARTASGTLVVAIVLLHFGWVARAVTTDPRHKSFQPMAAFVQRQILDHRGTPFLVMSSAELGFAVGFRPDVLRDDALLGYRSGRKADLIVIDQRAYGSHYLGFQKTKPEIAAWIDTLLTTEFQGVYNDGYYRVYRRL